MAKKEKNADGSSAPLTVEDVQRMIDASLIRHDVTHGHLHAEDAARLLKELEDT